MQKNGATRQKPVFAQKEQSIITYHLFTKKEEII